MVSSVKTKDGIQRIKAYKSKDFPLNKIKFSKMQRNKRIYLYADEFGVLDTETSHINDAIGWVYQWAVKFNGNYCYGRTPEELITLLERMRNTYKLHNMKRIIIYIHNASYDLQYLKHFLYKYDPDMHMMAIDNHTVLICDIFGFRILCSYKLSNMNLDLFSNTFSEKYIKASGAINYNIVRYQDEKLTANDWFYMFSDVASQHDAITNYLYTNGYDKAYKAPFTSTGFVRVACRKASEKSDNWRKEFNNGALDYEQYNLCKQAFMGGITICSYKYSNQLIEGVNIGHKDFTSSYPARQMMDYFPTGKPSWYGEVEDLEELNYLIDNFCVIFMIHIENLQIREGVTAPYIPSSKCIKLKDELKVNGKVILAKELSMVVTEIDYKWIKKQYTCKSIKVDHVLKFARGKAPDWLKGKIMEYYINKCTLKNSNPKLYMASKALLNSIYGMSATSIIRRSYVNGKDLIIQPKEDQGENDYIKQLTKFYLSFNSFMPFQYGVYTTAHARDALMQMIETVGYDNFIYCDTDSVFYISTPEAEKRLNEMNEKIKDRAIKNGAYYEDNYLGYATDEAPIKRFKAIHAKCYAMEELNKEGEYELKVTIAGIPKKSIKWVNGEKIEKSNAEELGDLDNLKDGFIFRHCGGTRCIYNEMGIKKEVINGHKTIYASSAIIENIEKEISDTMYSIDKDYSLLNIKQEMRL